MLDLGPSQTVVAVVDVLPWRRVRSGVWKSGIGRVFGVSLPFEVFWSWARLIAEWCSWVLI